MCFGLKLDKQFGRPKLVQKRHPGTRFGKGALAATKWCQTTQNFSFRPKLVDLMRFG